MAKQHLVCLLLLLMITPCLRAQKKELSLARSYIKSGKYTEAEKAMTDLLKDSANRDNKRIYLTWYDAVRGQYDQGNEKLYLKQKYDTAAFFSTTKRLFVVAEKIDSVEMRPDRKGRVVLDYRNKHAAQMNAIRPNLFNGGTYHVRKGNWKEGYAFFETYLDCARQPLFVTYNYAENDQRMAEAAYWATYCGYKMNDAVLTLRYHKQALQDSARADFTLQFVAEARRLLKDDELYLATLKEGFRRYPQFPYFFPRLMDIYTSRGQYELALAVADSALAVNDSSQLYVFAKSSTLLRLGRYEESIVYSDRLMTLNDSLPEAYFNAGTAYVSMAADLNPRKDKRRIKSYYQKARFYVERYRKLAPKEQEKWAPLLYRIYLNLNMGKQFDEIDRMLRIDK